MIVERAKTDKATASTEGADLIIERVFDAPRELVWSVMNDPARISDWWGPNGYTTTVETMDVRPGGSWRFINHAPDGSDHPFKGEYREVVPNERIVYTFVYDVEGIRDFPAIVTATFESLDGGRSKLSSRTDFGSAETLEMALGTGMIEGGLETWDRLELILQEELAGR